MHGTVIVCTQIYSTGHSQRGNQHVCLADPKANNQLRILHIFKCKSGGWEWGEEVEFFFSPAPAWREKKYLVILGRSEPLKIYVAGLSGRFPPYGAKSLGHNDQVLTVL